MHNSQWIGLDNLEILEAVAKLKKQLIFLKNLKQG